MRKSVELTFNWSIVVFNILRGHRIGPHGRATPAKEKKNQKTQNRYPLSNLTWIDRVNPSRRRSRAPSGRGYDRDYGNRWVHFRHSGGVMNPAAFFGPASIFHSPSNFD